MSTSSDLWPDDLTAVIPRTPTNILQEQAAALGNKTNNVVQAKVRQETDSDGDFVLKFVLFSPALRGYEYELFSVWHKEDLYPVGAYEHRLDSEQELIDYLRGLFREEKTVRVVRALIAQARGSDDIPF